MYHLYSGTGEISDSSSTKRAIQVTVMISDQLLDQNNQPVILTPGQPLPGGQYRYTMSGWNISVDKIATFFGQSGFIGIQNAAPPLGIVDIGWLLTSDATNDYNWGGDISSMTQPNKVEWPDPANPGFAQLPQSLNFTSPGAGAQLSETIRSLFSYPDAAGTTYRLQFVLQRV